MVYKLYYTILFPLGKGISKKIHAAVYLNFKKYLGEKLFKIELLE
ncbi:hypothetical protein CLOSTMETH_00691 [[Clostridium] methylpentosum DSM 5476]|uniref:Uncharacterized protein n=1 Tax=[Clostridium] methylpentosum DSM 5476 TaxID=537013 RepID=C0EA37_9FIRM|nr:hypothetical protein CLOSTMETH_00691 [[Clostridium] methylpentosum DSM 5476]